MPTNASAEFGNQIIQALAPKSLSTPNLAAIIQANRDRVYRKCRLLEDKGLLSRSHGGRPATFCVDCHRGVSHDNYELCRAAGHDLRSYSARISIWALTSQAQANTGGSQETTAPDVQ